MPVSDAPAFFDFFVAKTDPFAHIDIARVATHDSATDLCVVGPNGYGVRTLFDLAESMC